MPISSTARSLTAGCVISRTIRSSELRTRTFNKTSLVVAHRLTTIRRVNRIFVVHDG
jgi:ABC-type multidrug transport system fused ATPase/permease subunit